MRRIFSWIILLNCFFAAPAYAELVTSIDNIEVDASAPNALEARTKAIAQGEMEAFKQLLQKIAPEVASVILAKMDAERVSGLVQGYEVVEEKMTSDRYRATLRYSFDPDGLQNLLNVATSNPTLSVPKNSKTVVVLPVLNDNGILKLWETDNDWRMAFGQVAMQQGGGHVLSAFGDKDDKKELDGPKAAKAGFIQIALLAGRYGASDVYVVTASTKPDDLSKTLFVHVRRVTETGSEVNDLEFPLKTAENRGDQLMRAAAEVVAQLRRGQTDINAPVDENAIGTLPVRIIQAEFKEWEAIRRKLQGLTNVVRVDVTSMSYYQTDLVITYRGSPDILGRTLANTGFRMFRDGDMLVLALE